MGTGVCCLLHHSVTLMFSAYLGKYCPVCFHHVFHSPSSVCGTQCSGCVTSFRGQQPANDDVYDAGDGYGRWRDATHVATDDDVIHDAINDEPGSRPVGGYILKHSCMTTLLFIRS